MRILVIVVFALFALAPSALAQCVPTQANNYCFGQSGTTQPSGGGSVNSPTQPSGGGGTDTKLLNPLQSGDSLQSFLIKILEFVIYIGSIVVMLMLVYVGFLFVTARGEPGKITEARSALLWTLVGALVLLGSKAIAYAIEATVKALGG